MPEVPHSIIMTNARLGRALRKCCDARASEQGLTFARMEALLVIRTQEGLSQTELADRLMIETPTMNRTLDGLVRDGFVERRPDEEDKRIRRIWLTDSARTEADKLAEFSFGLRSALVAGIPTEELDAAEATLKKIFANLRHLSGTTERSDG